MALAWRWLLPALPFAALALRLARGLRVVRAFERQRRRSSSSSSSGRPICVCVADALHRPLGLLSVAAVALRLSFFLLAAVAGFGGARRAPTLCFWLSQAPAVAHVALSAYLALLLLAVVHARQWPTRSEGGASIAVAAAGIVCSLVCVLLVVEVTLLAMTRSAVIEAPREHYGRLRAAWRLQDEQDQGLENATPNALGVIAKATFLYLAFVWSVLGLLLLRVQGNAVRVLLGREYPSRSRRRLSSRGIEPDKTLPPVFVMNLSLGSIWLALLLLLRGAYSAIIGFCCDPSQLAHWLFLPGGARSWHDFWTVLALDSCWELLVLLVVISLLKNMPIAVYAWPSTANMTESAAETDATDPTDESDDADESDQLLSPSSPSSSPRLSTTPVQGFRFQLPTLHELVQDYVIVTRRSLSRRQPELDEAIYTYAHGEPERCIHQIPTNTTSPRSASSETRAEVVGSEFMECQCPTRHHDRDLLPEAQVPLLSDDDDSFEVIDTGSDGRSDDGQALLTPS